MFKSQVLLVLIGASSTLTAASGVTMLTRQAPVQTMQASGPGLIVDVWVAPNCNSGGGVRGYSGQVYYSYVPSSFDFNPSVYGVNGPPIGPNPAEPNAEYCIAVKLPLSQAIQTYPNNFIP